MGPIPGTIRARMGDQVGALAGHGDVHGLADLVCFLFGSIDDTAGVGAFQHVVMDLMTGFGRQDRPNATATDDVPWKAKIER